jgi:UDP-galactopyranose mutase
MKKILIVGAGFFGATIAERAASLPNCEVHIVEKRNHLGGNAWSDFDANTGIEVHKYGTHLFHTSNDQVWNYVNQFTKFNSYVHRVKTVHAGQVFGMPINLHTINQFFGKTYSPSEAQTMLHALTTEEILNPRNLEEKAISLIGRELYEAFIKGYTQKQWQTEPVLLPEEIITRLPVRFNYNDRYFDDVYEGLPLDGYGALFNRMLTNKNIKISTDFDFHKHKEMTTQYDLVVYTGPIDQYFEFSHGALSWRTLDFEFEHLQLSDFQGTSVMNYSDLEIPFTRIHEFKHLHPERPPKTNETVIAREFSRFASRDDEPYYPINTSSDREMLLKYRELAKKEKKVIFGGRLGSYKYLDMHMAIASALVTYENSVKRVLLN